MEPNRTWHQPVIEIFSTLITPTVRYAANAYDLANRRWYRLDVEDPEVPADEWLAEPVASHVTAYFAKHGECPLWNVIRLPYREAGASGEAEFVWQERGVERPMQEWLGLRSAAGVADGAGWREKRIEVSQPVGGSVYLGRGESAFLRGLSLTVMLM